MAKETNFKEEREAFIESVLGEYETDVKSVMLEGGGKFRIVARDGRRIIETSDVNANRLNVHIKNGIVVKAYFG